MIIYTLYTKIYMLSFKIEKVQKVTGIQIAIRLTSWMPYKDLKLLISL